MAGVKSGRWRVTDHGPVFNSPLITRYSWSETAMLATLLFSLVGCLVFALVAIALVYLMAVMGGGQRVQGHQVAPTSRVSSRPRR